MNFSPQAQSIFDAYENRWQDESEKMRTGDPKAIMLNRDDLLLAIGKETGEFLVSLLVAHGAKNIIEVGTSYGYSTLFLAHAAQQTGGRLTTLEIDANKQNYAREKMQAAGLSDVIDWHCGDAVSWLETAQDPFDFVLLDVWKELYIPCLNAIKGKMSEEGIIAADNMISPPMHRQEAREYRNIISTMPEFNSVLLPIGSGIELSCKWSQENTKL
ncbi:MAG: methyltransferase [Robiginitomaculum sp.]|nr:MAG: methyltransferase [Robiginitomaculum sp.]